MAEALAVVPLVIEALKLSKKLEETIQTCKNTPSELLVLGNELTELSLVISEIDISDEPDPSPLRKVLARAESQLKVLEAFIETFATLITTKSKRTRMKWVRARQQALAMQDEIRAIKANLTILLAARTM